MIYVFHGEDNFSASEAVRRILEAAGPPEMRESNVTQLEAGEFSIERFGNAAMVMPFLADRRVVVVRGLLGAAEGQRTGRRGKRATATSDAGPGKGLPELLAQLPPFSDAVFVEGKVGTTNPLLASIRELGREKVVIKEFQMLRRDALADWVRDRAAKKGAQIDSRAVALLAEQVGANLWALDMEMEKLSIYASGRPITVEDVHALVSTAKEASIFDLVDAIMDRRADAALRVMERLLHEGATGQSLLAMIARQARMVALAQELARLRVPQNEWGGRIGTSSDFVVRKTAEQARRFTPAAVRGLYRLLLDTDLAMKTGESSDELAMTEFLARASTLASAARMR